MDNEIIYDLCRRFNIYDEIMSMPMGFHTIISEMGLNISGGQRQRLALVRALVNNPKIIILDEATSALDNINERKVAKYLTEKGCTQIIIAHRLATVIDADYIYVLKEGKIIEEGTNEELLDRKGEYYRLYMSGK